MAYATFPDLYRFGASEDMLRDIERADQEAALAAASLEADSLVRGQVATPVQKAGGVHPVDLIRAVCQIAAYDLLSVRGFSDEAFEGNMRKRAEASREWLRGIGRGNVHPTWADASSDGAAGYDGPLLLDAFGELPSPRGL